MPYQHFLRKRRSVRIGGWRLGPWSIGGGAYTVGPLSTIRWLQFVEAAGQMVEAMPDSGADIQRLVEAHPTAALAPLVPLLVEEPVAQRHLRRITVAQILSVWTALSETVDLDYVMKAFTPKLGQQKRDPIGLEVLLTAIVERSHVYTHRDLLLMPVQEVLAIADASKALDDASRGDGGVPTSPEERDELKTQFAALGFVVN